MPTPRTTSFKFLPLAVLASLFSSSVFAQVPELRWSFDAEQGTPRRSISLNGGVLSIKNGTDGTATFEPKTGVGAATPGVLDASANAYGDGYSAARITSAESPLVADAALPQCVITLWIKPTVSPSAQSYARLLNISPANNERGAPGLYMSLNNENLEVGMNGHIWPVKLTEGGIRKGEWTFLALVYDGASDNPYYCTDMMDLVQTHLNAAVIIGGLTSEARSGGAVALSTGAPNYNVTPGPLVLNGLCVALGCGNGKEGRSFVGLIDDVRVYKGLLTIKEIDEIRRSSLAAK